MNSTHGAFDLYLGYRFTKYVGLEFAYSDLGRVDGNYIGTVGPLTVPVTEAYRVNSRSLAVAGRLPVWSSVSLVGKLGASGTSVWTKTCADVLGTTGCSQASNHGVTPLVAGGLEYDFSKDFSLRTMYTYLGDVGKSSTTGKATAGLATVDLQVNF
jgi:OOP family OmpA-OmpF porin